jgi:hypothetical protein
MGQFVEGNPGRPKGAINRKTKLWNELGDFITSEGAERAVQVLRELDDKEFLRYYVVLAEFFKPKQSRQMIEGNDVSPVQIIIQEGI